MTSPLITQLTCSICHRPVSVETSKTDENGNPVHEDCYVQRVMASLHDSPNPHHAK